jgi:hypothetical protein
MSIALRTQWLTMLVALLSAGVSRAELADITIPSGEHVVFAEDFDNNDNGWSNIGSSGSQATIGTDPGGTGESVIYPSNPDGSFV